MSRRFNVCAMFLLVTVTAVRVSGQPDQQPDRPIQDLTALSLEELLALDVTTVSRSSERRVEAPAAISVVTGEDIRRYGVNTLADALRLADSVNVARFNAGSWGISTRGFTAVTNNKLLVLIDGRSIYTQLFGGVFWEAHHVLLPDLERIEIIRGPAGTLWGPNAVNGVINIITKSAMATEGVLARLNVGSRERHHVAVRWGIRLSPTAAFRTYLTSSNFGSPQLQSGASAGEERSLHQTGARYDWESLSQARLTIQGDANLGRMGLPDRADITMNGANVVATFTRPLNPGASFQILGYVDHAHREVPRQSWGTRTTYDIEGQHGVRITPRYHVVWGAGARATVDRTQPTDVVFFSPDDRTIRQIHGFGQAEITVRPDLAVTLGTRAERSTFSRFELQPSVRASYTPGNSATIWGAISRASRTPTRFDQDLRIRVGNVVVLQGDAEFKSEHLIAYETGARLMKSTRVSVEASIFHHDYDNLRSQEPTLPAGIPIVLANKYAGRSTGVELAGDVQPVRRWLLHASYTAQRIDLKPEPGSRDTTQARAEAEDPSQMFSLRSYLNLPGRFELDAFLRAVGKPRVSSVPAYSELDLRLGWQLNDRIELSVTGRELLHKRHPELAGGSAQLRYFQREVVARATFQSR
jgi:iron complex outermembrane receptor protein